MDTPETIKIPGKSVTICGVDYVFAPLPLGPLAELQEAMPGFTMDSSNPVHTRAITAAAFASLRRNYPNITLDKVGNELVDVGNMAEVLGAFMGGAEAKQPGEPAAQ